MKTIDFCIPFIGSGLQYVEFLIANLLATAAHPERISISLSAHTQNDVELIKKSPFHHLVKRIVMATAGDNIPNARFAMESTISSANHCSAIESLFNHATADIVIFSDYDMAFLIRGWDLKMVALLEHNDLCGVEYPHFMFLLDYTELPELKVIARNYMNTPNLSFLAISRESINRYFPKGMSSFHYYLADGGLPFQIVNTVDMVQALHLPLGTVWWMDSGAEIPFVVHHHQLQTQTFMPVAFEDQPVFSPEVFAKSPEFAKLPDVFSSDGKSVEPFLAHYKGGTLRSMQDADNNQSFNYFMDGVDKFLARNN